ncbi:MAG: arsenate reductase family protein [Clostridia bacterium]|nr:arsenate reductase family protein [Clostridia bacterium]
MGIQIFGTKKSADSRKAERFFKERGVKFQYVDLKEKGLSRGELQSVINAVGRLDDLIDADGKDKDLLILLLYLTPEDQFDKVLENQSLLKQPVVRNGKQATVGYMPDVWKTWQF